jgi:hypothetical protein
MSIESLPEIAETKHTLAGTSQVFRCRLLTAGPSEMAILFISDRDMAVHDVRLPAGTVTFAYFWTELPYNVYHWMSPAGTTLGHYFNVSDRTEIAGDSLSWRDLAVDVLVNTRGEIFVLDEDEVPPDLDHETRSRIEAAKRRLLPHAASETAGIEQRSRALWPRAFGGTPWSR